MKPIDYRNETWDQVRERVTDLRGAVYDELAAHGPCTTRELAHKCGIDLLTVRPRVTELYQLGLVELANPETGGGEGIYRTIPLHVAKARFEIEQSRLRASEAQLPLI